MSRFVLGDDLGNIKTLRYLSDLKEEPKTRVTTIYKHDPSHGLVGVQQLASSSQANDSISVCDHLQLHRLVFLNRMLQAKLAAAFSNGTCFISTINEEDALESLSEWKESRSGGSEFVGIALTKEYVTPDPSKTHCLHISSVQFLPVLLMECCANQCSPLSNRKTHLKSQNLIAVFFRVDYSIGDFLKIPKRLPTAEMKSTSQYGTPVSHLKPDLFQPRLRTPSKKENGMMTCFQVKYGEPAMSDFSKMIQLQ